MSSYEINPFDVPDSERIELLSHWTETLLGFPGIDHADAAAELALENKYYADTAGTETTQQRVRVHPLRHRRVGRSRLGGVRDHADAGPAGRAGLGVPDRRQAGTGTPSWRRCPNFWLEKVRAPSVDAGVSDLVIDPSNLWLTIHESIGHATELDRALGYEAAYAGTSFATFDRLGSLHYGSPLMHVTGDRTAEHGLATIGYDDEGVGGPVLGPHPRRAS